MRKKGKMDKRNRNVRRIDNIFFFFKNLETFAAENVQTSHWLNGLNPFNPDCVSVFTAL